MFRDVGMPDVASMPARTVDEHEAALAAGLLWVADAEGLGPVGFAMASAMKGSLYLAELSVQPSHGRRGLGAALVECVVEAAAARGHRAVTLSTFTHVPWNAPYYRRLGFVDLPPERLPDELRAVREREAAVGLDLDQRVVMRRPLDDPPRAPRRA
jgi:predicted N-acetyltransferase YhbS